MAFVLLHKKAACGVLIAMAAAAVALACCGAEAALEFMKYHAAIGTVAAFAVLCALVLFNGRSIAAKCFHLGIALVLGGWVISQFVSPVDKNIMLYEGDIARLSRTTELQLDKFTIDYWHDTGTVRQYTSALTILTKQPPFRRATVAVNHPLVVDGWWLYQSSWGKTHDYPYTVLLCVKDCGLPIVTCGGILLLVGALLLILRRRTTPLTRQKLPRPLVALYSLTFAAALAMFIHRGLATGHAPMQNMYEFLICAAVCIPLLTFISARRDGQNSLLIDSALLTLVTIPVGFFMNGATKHLMPALQSPLFIPHVGAYVASYIILVRAALGAGRNLIPLGFTLMTLGLVLGSAWGKICWGNWWMFDPKEMWSLATWFVFATYFHKRSNTLLYLGAVLIVLTLTWINLSKLFTGMHSYA